jgi:D-glycero-alpha-D-manno-heptose-7-phosphate kinase
MIVSRTPFRISFFGGGTDFPAWSNKHGGSVLATTIDKYCYLTCRYLPPFFQHRYRIVWSKIETCRDIEEVSHPAVREVIKSMNMDRCLEIHHVGDLPARSGMGSSSSFTVGLINALSALEGRMLTKQELFRQGILMEQQVLKENVGSQDQVCASFGGLNHIEFLTNGEISVRPVTLRQERIQELQSHLMLFYTGIERTSSDVTKHFVDEMDSKKRQLRIMKDLVDEALSILNGDRDIIEFGELLHEGWHAKRSLSEVVTNPKVDDMFEAATDAGAIGGKLTGAGGGGFLLLFVPPHYQAAVRVALKRLLHVPFKFEYSGSQIIFADYDADYTDVEKAQEELDIAPFQDLTKIISAIGARYSEV